MNSTLGSVVPLAMFSPEVDAKQGSKEVSFPNPVALETFENFLKSSISCTDMTRLSLHLDAFKQNTWWDNVARSRPGVPWEWWTWKKSFQISKSQKINWGYSGSPTPYHIHVQVSWGTWLVLHCYIQENMKWFERFFLSDPYQVRPWSAFVPSRPVHPPIPTTRHLAQRLKAAQSSPALPSRV